MTVIHDMVKKEWIVNKESNKNTNSIPINHLNLLEKIKHSFPVFKKKSTVDNEKVCIKEMCYQSIPCQHYVKLSTQPSSNYKMMYGSDILEYLQKNGYKDIPEHFLGYEKISKE